VSTQIWLKRLLALSYRDGGKLLGGEPVSTQSKNLLVLSGPNLNLLGDREPELYGDLTLADHLGTVESTSKEYGLEVEHFQSNLEGELVESIQRARDRCVAIIINPGALTHYAWSIHDALAAFDGPIVEVHLTNPAAREPWRHTSVIAPVASGTIAGFGSDVYRLAVIAVAELLGLKP